MMRGSLLFVGVCCAVMTAQAQEAQPTLSQLTAASAANIAAFDNFYCQFDVQIGLVLYNDSFQEIQFDHVNGVGHGVWAKKGLVELYDFRQEGESKWDNTGGFSYGPLIYTEALIRTPGFQLHLKKNGTITSAPNADFHPRLDPLSLFHMVEGEQNVRLPDLLARFAKEQAADAAAASRIPNVAIYYLANPERKLDHVKAVTDERNLSLDFAAGDYALPKMIGYSYANSEGSPWRDWRQHILETESIEGVGTFPKKMIVIHPQAAGERPLQAANWRNQGKKWAHVAYGLLWQLKTIEYREPTADELTYRADRDLPIFRAGFARVTYVNEDETITPESLPEIYKLLVNKPPQKTEQEEKAEAK
ncbi:hypothetical protein [Blastopirellula marina]|uniref:Uncharacterized protein n=1 Tax=Blastopirellula marina DSM 3645 TaxID=314230 RepID=A3ZRI2_9BACT|nr:hypothetical protein [Blastopirellula marina]EAQ80751.1 hypothetical protein DSM3645_12061 [Blastopirellula marina DSM 3645]